MSRWFLLTLGVIAALEKTPAATSFAVMPASTCVALPVSSRRNPCKPRNAQDKDADERKKESKSSASYDPEEEVQRRLAKAKEVLAKSKAKLESKKADDDEDSSKVSTAEQPKLEAVPFFAAKTAVKDNSTERREKMTKSTNDKTGLVTADGDKMAAMSEKEEWERRPLLEVFDNEVQEDGDVYSSASKGLADRDVAASIWNLRKKLKTEDYLRIFDKKNFFIGEDN